MHLKVIQWNNRLQQEGLRVEAGEAFATHHHISVIPNQ